MDLSTGRLRCFLRLLVIAACLTVAGGPPWAAPRVTQRTPVPAARVAVPVTASDIDSNGAQNIAVIEEDDWIAQIHVRHLLARRGIGSTVRFAHAAALWVPQSMGAAAVDVLDRDARAHDYAILLWEAEAAGRATPKGADPRTYGVRVRLPDRRQWHEVRGDARLAVFLGPESMRYRPAFRAFLCDAEVATALSRYPHVEAFRFAYRTYLDDAFHAAVGFDVELRLSGPAARPDAPAIVRGQVLDGGREVLVRSVPPGVE